MLSHLNHFEDDIYTFLLGLFAFTLHYWHSRPKRTPSEGFPHCLRHVHAPCRSALCIVGQRHDNKNKMSCRLKLVKRGGEVPHRHLDLDKKKSWANDKKREVPWRAVHKSIFWRAVFCYLLPSRKYQGYLFRLLARLRSHCKQTAPGFDCNRAETSSSSSSGPSQLRWFVLYQGEIVVFTCGETPHCFGTFPINAGVKTPRDDNLPPSQWLYCCRAHNRTFIDRPLIAWIGCRKTNKKSQIYD